MTSLKHEWVNVLNTGSDLKAKVISLSPIAEILPSVKSRRCELVAYHQQSKTFRRRGCLLGSFCYYFESTSEGFSQVLWIKTGLFYLSNLSMEQNHLSEWVSLGITFKRQAPIVLWEIECMLQAEHSVSAKSSVWSLWEIKNCLPLVTGALRA